jgi:hypothetical protein
VRLTWPCTFPYRLIDAPVGELVPRLRSVPGALE